MKRTAVFSLLCLLVINCKQRPKSDIQNTPEEETSAVQQTGNQSGIAGNYVDDSYAKRADGYDWVAVMVMLNNAGSISVSIRSRADKKEPTCTFDATAYPLNETTYQAVYDGKTILFQFTEEALTISTEKETDSGVLYFFCSGGATIAGSYKKIGEELDASQIDQTLFSQVLNLQGIGFNVSSIEENGRNTLSIFTFGLETREFDETIPIEGERVIRAAVEDLNADGSPELFVFTRSEENGNAEMVRAFSVNNRKSMSMVYFQPTAENDQINDGYRGQDEFAIVENYLVQRFPIYKNEDADDNPSGGIRQVAYKLVEGEALRKLEVDNITEY